MRGGAGLRHDHPSGPKPRRIGDRPTTGQDRGPTGVDPMKATYKQILELLLSILNDGKVRDEHCQEAERLGIWTP
jgi:hypothetical protein